MNYQQQMANWIKKHPKATIEEAYEAGYLQCSVNWCRKER